MKSAISSASSDDMYQSCLLSVHQDGANRPLRNLLTFGDGPFNHLWWHQLIWRGRAQTMGLCGPVCAVWGSPRHPKTINSFSCADGIRGCCATIRTDAGTLRSGFSDGRRLKEHHRTSCEAVGLRNLPVNRLRLQRCPPKAAEGKGDKFLFPGC